jgi:hypothetical protein
MAIIGVAVGAADGSAGGIVGAAFVAGVDRKTNLQIPLIAREPFSRYRNPAPGA